ncbi:MAG: Na/Pi cotransporter family protein [Geobacteraceae bacterium]|nr:Na/Pi cotransporter family protein [Geobacteraceae bacterium]
MSELETSSLQAAFEALGGGGLFIFGIRMMSEGLQRIAGNRFRTILDKVVSSRISAALLGTSIASLLHSSNSASILTVGFLNAGLISIYQALAIFLGASLGASLAVQFIAFQPYLLALAAVFAGIFLKLFFKRNFLANTGELLLGAGILFIGLRTMQSGLSFLSGSTFMQFLDHYVFAWRISAVLFGSLLTFILQSSSAATGIIIALCGSGIVTFNESIGIIIGSNLGTAFMTLFAAIGGTSNARKAALVNLIINITSVILVLFFFPMLIKAVLVLTPSYDLYIPDMLNSQSYTPLKGDLPRLIANAHTIVSLFMVIIFLPLIGFLSRSVKLSGSSTEISAHSDFLDKRVINTPTIAMIQASKEVARMSHVVTSMYRDTVHLLYRFDAKSARRIIEMENAVDSIHCQLSNYLVLLSRKSFDRDISIKLPLLLQAVNQLEHLADINMRLLMLIQKKKTEKISFSTNAMSELKKLAASVDEIVNMAEISVELDENYMQELSALRSKTGEIRETAIAGHLKRMKTGHCSIEAGFLYNDIITLLINTSDSSANLIEIKGELE